MEVYHQVVDDHLLVISIEDHGRIQVYEDQEQQEREKRKEEEEQRSFHGRKGFPLPRSSLHHTHPLTRIQYIYTSVTHARDPKNSPQLAPLKKLFT